MTTDSNPMDRARKLFDAGDYANAESLYREGLQEQTENHHSVMMLGLCRHKLGDPVESLNLLRPAARLGTDDSEAQLLLARAELDQGHVNAARQALKQCIAINPNHLEARTTLGQLELQSSQPRAAADSLKAALRIDPDHGPARAGLAMALLEVGQFEGARNHAMQAIDNEPDNATAQIAMARVFQGQGHLGFAEQCLRNALRLRPDSGEIWAALGGVLASNDQHAEAVKTMIQALKHGGCMEFTVLGMANSLHKLGRLDEARYFLEQILSEQPDHPGAQAMLAEIALDGNHIESARTILVRLADVQADAVVLLRARLAEQAGEFEKAHALATPLYHSDNPDIAAKARMLVGRVALARSSAVTARKALGPLIEAGHNEPEASWLLADTILASGQLERAVGTLEKLIDSRLDISPVIRARTARRIGLILDQAGRYARAAQFLLQPGWLDSADRARIRGDSLAPIYEACRAATAFAQDDLVTDDGRPQPVFVLGWPGSGRDLVLTTLRQQPELTFLDRTLDQHRRKALGVPQQPDELAAVDVARQRLGRRHFMRELRGKKLGAAVIDPCWWESASLPALARYFPGTSVILPRAEPAALELYWRMAGYREIEEMLAHLRDRLPLRFVEIELDELLEAPERALGRLSEIHGIDIGSRTIERIASVSSQSLAGIFPDLRNNQPKPLVHVKLN